MIKVSVIVPVYNEEQHLQECINSICNQTLKEIEIICVDDGSTDSSRQILRSFAEKDRRIKLIFQKNKFAGVARNNGMKCARGKYLSFLDGDDYFEPDMLEKMYERAEAGEFDVVICRYEQFCEKNKRIIPFKWIFIDSFFDQKDEFSGEKLKYAGIFQITNGWAWDKLFRTEFVHQCGYTFSDFRSSEDGFFVYMLVARAKRISYLNDILLTHRENQPNSLSNTKENDWLNGFRMLLLIMNEMKRLNIYDIYKQSFLNKVIDFLSWYLDSMHSFEAYEKCYNYIQSNLEPKVRVLDYSREYYFKDSLYDSYKNVCNFSLEEYLFWYKEKNFATLSEYAEAMDRLRGIIAKQAEGVREKNWVFPFCLFEKDKTIVLYGAGKIGSAYYSQLIESQFCKEVIWVDKRYKEYAEMGLAVQRPDIISTRQFDSVCIAVKNKDIQEEVTEWFLGQGIQPEQIKCYGME